MTGDSVPAVVQSLFARSFPLRVAALLFCLLLWPCRGSADVRLPRILADHMVLQRDQPIHIWGWADAGEKVTVRLKDSVATTTAKSDGVWEVMLPAQSAGGPFDLTVTGKNQLQIKDLLIGEVWVCSGQSNMAWVMAHQTRNHTAEIAAADNPQLRLFTVPEKSSATDVDDIAAPHAQWLVCSPRTVGYFSAVAYYFGRELQRELKVPVGLVVAAVSGTRIEPWTPDAGIESITELASQRKYPSGDLFRGMIRPLTPLTIRGVIWYQGEGNVGDGFVYYHRMRALIGGWRSAWQRDDLPFYYVQLAPLNWGGKPVTQLPEIWEAQTAALSIPHTGMVVTTDIGNIGDAHPRNKQEVGARLARWALAKTYGRHDVTYSGPLYKSIAIEGNKARIRFDHATGGLSSRDGKPLTWFTIAGGDGKLAPAKAEIDGESVLVSSDTVPHPIAVRFGWHQIAEPNLMNKAGLPASPFRTDGHE